MEAAEAARIPVTAYLSVSEVLAHPHFRERGAFVAADHPRAGRLEYVGAPWRMERGYAAAHAPPRCSTSTAPRCGPSHCPRRSHRTTEPTQEVLA